MSWNSILAALSAILVLTASETISDQCEIQEETTVRCSCVGNEEFFLPDNYNYENVTSVFVSSCTSGNMHFSSLTEAKGLRELVIQNISGTLIFEPFLTTRNLTKLQLLNIGRIPVVSHDTFTSLTSLQVFHAENIAIGHFEEQFLGVVVSALIFQNVTVGRMDGLNLSERGKVLQLVDCDFGKVETTLNFAFFADIAILGSKFELQRPSHVSIEGTTALVEDSVFLNVSLNLVAFNQITIRGICADGKSSLRLSSNSIESLENRLPTEIIYTKSQGPNDRGLLLSRNNTVCIAGNCKCLKSEGNVFHLHRIAVCAVLLLFYKVMLP
ncbi:uncharacterized protein LOC105703989 [Orussus abietinus]|uniref:uncharacterized protein LOC105703989 n=1 Tax=Orussus abietinus TaxID=222816 RepID=UPI0006264E11|nr:uncharacterized protein LOC105703989 [Orussus abietinus]